MVPFSPPQPVRWVPIGVKRLITFVLVYSQAHGTLLRCWYVVIECLSFFGMDCHWKYRMGILDILLNRSEHLRGHTVLTCGL